MNCLSEADSCGHGGDDAYRTRLGNSYKLSKQGRFMRYDANDEYRSQRLILAMCSQRDIYIAS